MTLARRHYQRTSAASASAGAAPGEQVNASAYELMLARLAEDRRRLKEVQSIERKIEVKRTLLPEYEPWVTGALESGRGGQDAVLMTIMVWRIDTGDYSGALQIAEYALAHDLVMPDHYQRGVPTVISEEIADRALAILSTGGEFDHVCLSTVEQLTRDCDMPDEVRAKVHKALGLALAAKAGNPPFAGPSLHYAEIARDHLRRALQLHDRVGVKKEIERLDRALKNSPAATDAGSTGEASTEPGAAAAPE